MRHEDFMKEVANKAAKAVRGQDEDEFDEEHSQFMDAYADFSAAMVEAAVNELKKHPPNIIEAVMEEVDTREFGVNLAFEIAENLHDKNMFK